MTEKMTNRMKECDVLSGVSETVVDMDLDEDAVNFEISSYEEEEIAQINTVLMNYKAFHVEERQRKKNLETSLEETIKSIQIGDVDSGKTFCLVCHEKFTLVMKKRKVCSLCQRGVCIRCSWKFKNKKIYVCKLCYMTRTRDGMTGKWFKSLSKSHGRLRRAAVPILISVIRKSREVPTPVPEQNGKSKDTLHQLLHLAKKGAPMLMNLPFVGKEVNRLRDKAEHAFDKAVDITDRAIHDMENGEAGVLIREVKSDVRRLAREGQSNLEVMSPTFNSMLSICSEAEESFNHHLIISGDISLSICYDEGVKLLRVHIEQCRNIAVADRKKSRTDPYVKTYLLPDKNKITKKKSAVKKRTINPHFDETMTYYVEKDELISKTLSVSVWHKSSLILYNIFLGEVQFLLSEIDLDSKTSSWHPFHDRRNYLMKPGGVNFRGDLSIKLKYKTDTDNINKGALQVTINGMNHVETELATINSYVKCYLLPDKDPKSKRKTNICKNNFSPLWNTLLTFPNVTLEELRDRSLELSVYSVNILNMPEFLCGIRLNLGLGLHGSENVHWMDACGKERELWEQCLSNPDECVEAVLNMRSNVVF